MSKASDSLKEQTYDEIRKAIEGRHLDKAVGLIFGVCKLPDKVSELAEWVAKPYCSAYDDTRATLETQIQKLEETLEWMPLIQQLMALQLDRRKKSVAYLDRVENGEVVTP